VTSEKHSNLASLKMDYDDKMKILNEIKREQELRAKYIDQVKDIEHKQRAEEAKQTAV